MSIIYCFNKLRLLHHLTKVYPQKDICVDLLLSHGLNCG